MSSTARADACLSHFNMSSPSSEASASKTITLSGTLVQSAPLILRNRALLAQQLDLHAAHLDERPTEMSVKLLHVRDLPGRALPCLLSCFLRILLNPVALNFTVRGGNFQFSVLAAITDKRKIRKHVRPCLLFQNTITKCTLKLVLPPTCTSACFRLQLLRVEAADHRQKRVGVWRIVECKSLADTRVRTHYHKRALHVLQR
jgi:hypothetical protein